MEFQQRWGKQGVKLPVHHQRETATTHHSRTAPLEKKRNRQTLLRLQRRIRFSRGDESRAALRICGGYRPPPTPCRHQHIHHIRPPGPRHKRSQSHTTSTATLMNDARSDALVFLCLFLNQVKQQLFDLEVGGHERRGERQRSDEPLIRGRKELLHLEVGNQVNFKG